MKRCLIGIAYILFFILIQPLYVYADSNDTTISIQIADEYETKLDTSDSTDDIVNGINEFLLQYRKIIFGIFCIATLTSVLLLLINLAYFGKAGAFAEAIPRKNAIIKLLLNAVGIAGLGGITVIYGLIYNIFG